MRAVVFHGPGEKSWDEVADPKIDDDDGRHRRDRRGHHLRHRPAHPQGRRPRGGARAGCSATRPSARSSRPATGVRDGAGRATACCCRASPPAAAAAYCRRGPLRPVPGRRRLGPRPPHRRRPGRVRPGAVRRHCRPTRCPTACRDEAGAVCSPTSCPPPTRSACSTAACGRATSWPSSAPARSVWRRVLTRRLYSPAARRRGRPGREPRWTRRKRVRRRLRSPIAGEAADGRRGAHRRARAPTWPSRRWASPQTFELCTALVRPGGRVANIGVHGKPATLHLEELWIKDVTITTGLVDTVHHPDAARPRRRRQDRPEAFTTHRFGLDDTMTAYDTFARAAETNAMKVLMTR